MSVLDGPLVFVDLETTGMSYTRGRVIEVAAIRVENGVVTNSLTSLVDPQTELPRFITELTGIRSPDLRDAPSFCDIAAQLHELMAGAVFVAHNVRFDYGFLKQEFSRAGLKFSPRLLCTVRLSRALYPSARGHKLQDLIDRCGLQVEERHRAYDDAQAVWQFIQHARDSFPAQSIEAAVRRQIKTPSLPKGLSSGQLAELPEAAGVYIFNDNNGSPLYIGKSVNIKQRVMSHFSADHRFESEFKISQQIADIQTIVTGGELSALLLESQLIKDHQPLYNRQLRRNQKMTLARQTYDDNGYIMINLEDVAKIQPSDLENILAVYTTRGQALKYLNQATKDFGLCPRLMGLESGSGRCFSYQLKRCRGACAGFETAIVYNLRLHTVFEGHRLQQWPYKSPVIISEPASTFDSHAIVVDQWCVIADVVQQQDCDPVIKFRERVFDIDSYKILRSYFASKLDKITIKPISLEQLMAV